MADCVIYYKIKCRQKVHCLFVLAKLTLKNILAHNGEQRLLLHSQPTKVYLFKLAPYLNQKDNFQKKTALFIPIKMSYTSAGQYNKDLLNVNKHP